MLEGILLILVCLFSFAVTVFAFGIIYYYFIKGDTLKGAIKKLW